MLNLQGNRIDLRTFTRQEYHRLMKSYIADPIMDPDQYQYDKNKVDTRFDFLTNREAWYPVLGIFRKEDHEPIGNVSIKRINYVKSQCELGISLVNDSVKGYGYGSEAISIVIPYIFDRLKLRYLYADTMESNIKMQHLFDKFHFRYLNKEEHCYDMHDRWEDKLNYVLENPNYMEYAKMRILYGTSNQGKLSSMKRTLSSLPIELLSLNEVPALIPDVIETGNTPLENARIKAKAYYQIVKNPVFSCDSGLYFEELPEQLQPGVHVRNVNGKYLTDDEMIVYYRSLAKRYGNLHGRYQNAICCIINDNHVYESMADNLSGNTFLLVDQPHHKRIPGFPLDSLSVHIPSGKYYYDLEQENVDAVALNHGFYAIFKKIIEDFQIYADHPSN